MVTMTAAELGSNAGRVRREVEQGRAIAVTYHRKLLAYVVTPEERDELHQLRDEVSRLRRQTRSAA